MENLKTELTQIQNGIIYSYMMNIIKDKDIYICDEQTAKFLGLKNIDNTVANVNPQYDTSLFRLPYKSDGCEILKTLEFKDAKNHPVQLAKTICNGIHCIVYKSQSMGEKANFIVIDVETYDNENIATQVFESLI